MTLWLPLAFLAYILYAISGAFDKVIVGNTIKNPLLISFWVALMGGASGFLIIIGVLPFDWASSFHVDFSNPSSLWLNLATGVVLQLSLLFGYLALKRDEATRVISTIGATTPIFALILATTILHERLSTATFTAFAFLLAGAVVMSIHRKGAIGPSFGLAVAAAGLAALQTILAKILYATEPFMSTFILFSVGGFLYALALPVIFSSVRHDLFSQKPKKRKKAKPKNNFHGVVLLFTNFVIGSLGVLALNYALKLGPASLINAMRGVQYAVLFMIALLLAKAHPKLLKEELSAGTMEQKVGAIALIAIGIVILTVAGQ